MLYLLQGGVQPKETQHTRVKMRFLQFQFKWNILHAVILLIEGIFNTDLLKYKWISFFFLSWLVLLNVTNIHTSFSFPEELLWYMLYLPIK